MAVRPFTINIDEAVLSDLRERLSRTRWPDAVKGAGWTYGTDPDVLRAWAERWRAFDWRPHETRLNALPQFTFPVEGVDLHFVHARSQRADALPLLLMNGWPSTFAEYGRIVETLTTPPRGERAFHVVIPSLPGFGFSSRPVEPGWASTRTAKAVACLMTELGYQRFGVHGSDLGAGVALALAGRAPERVVGLHSVNVYWGYPPPDDPTAEEKAYLEASQAWQRSEGAYAMLQGTKPQTLAPALNDSPSGLAAWVLEKWNAWSDGGLGAHDPDDVLTALTLYWATQTIGSSMRFYRESFQDPGTHRLGRSEVPAGVLVNAAEILPAPRAWGERWLNVQRWTESKRGGHFPALEIPDVLVAELRATFDAIS